MHAWPGELQHPSSMWGSSWQCKPLSVAYDQQSGMLDHLVWHCLTHINPTHHTRTLVCEYNGAGHW